MDKVYVVIYHSNAICDNMTPSHIVGVFSNEEKANEVCENIESRLEYDDDIVYVYEIEMNKIDLSPMLTRYYGCIKPEDDEDGDQT